tara:strand:- start:4550 stop:6865 length:2316 start_codon:yes stop_codon:yes gene_type:complete
MSTSYTNTYPASGYASEVQIRAEFDKVQVALDDTLSKSTKSGGNSMKHDLDMNTNDIFNAGRVLAGNITTDTLTLNGEQVVNSSDLIGGSGIASSVLDIAALRALEPIADKQRANILGHTISGTGGGEFWYDASDVASADDNGVTIVTTGGKRWRRVLHGYVTPQMFGGFADYNVAAGTGTDNQATIQTAQDFCEVSGDVLSLEGRYGIASQLIQKAIKVIGSVPGTSGLYALADNHRILSTHASLTSGKCLLKDFTIHGYADRNATLGADSSALVEISTIDEFMAVNIELANGRQMAMKSRARISSALRCHVHHIHRDGINFTDAAVRHIKDCTIEYIGDDAIACHANVGGFEKETVITGNILFNTMGIKCLSSNFTIADNRGEMIFGYGVQFGKASGFTEGEVDVKASTVSNNSFVNVINQTKIGLGDVGDCFYSRPVFSANANGFFPNDYDTVANTWVDPLDTTDVYGIAVPHIGNLGVVVSGNNVLQTWTGGTTISDYGDGLAWTTSGFQDVALTGALGKDGNKVNAYRFDSVAENVACHAGTTYGTTTGYLFQNIKRMANFSATVGQMSRISDKAISIVKDASVALLHCENAHIVGGSLDMDPLHEHADRVLASGEPTGAWGNTGSANCVGLYAPSVTGFQWRDTDVRNVQKVANLSGGGSISPSVVGLRIFAGDGTGVGAIIGMYDQDTVFTDSDPRSATYGTILQGLQRPRNSLPTTGSYFAGQRIKNSDLAGTLGGNKYTDLIRLTTGSGHVLGTDWGYVQFT